MPEMSAIELIDLGNFLASRLERLSADSRWAHRASGVRGSLLRQLEALELNLKTGSTPDPVQLERLRQAIEQGYTILVKAGREITVPDLRRN
jgi:hypothetical protein